MLAGYIVTRHTKLNKWSNQKALQADNYLHFKIVTNKKL